MSLALSTLIYEWRRYMAAVVALAFAGLLVLLVVGLFMGIGESFNAPIERSPADIMITNASSSTLLSGNTGVPRRLIPEFYMYPEVSQVQDLETNFSAWQNDPNAGGKGGKKADARSQRNGVVVYAIDNRPGSVTTPTDFSPSVREALDEPFAVAVDETALGPLGVKVGDKASMNGTTVTVRTTIHGYANVAIQTVFMSRQTALLVGVAHTGSQVGPLLVKIRDPANATAVRDMLNAHAHGQYRAWTRAEMAEANKRQLLKDNIIGIMLIGGLVIGGAVGLVITWQTLRGAIFANIKEFASLRALGVSMGSLRWVIMELSFWVGVAALGMTTVLVWVVTVVANASGLPMSYPVEWVVSVVALLLIVAIGSGLLSLGVLEKGQPADLLR
jgi:putative ABC transport system permease protein